MNTWGKREKETRKVFFFSHFIIQLKFSNVYWNRLIENAEHQQMQQKPQHKKIHERGKYVVVVAIVVVDVLVALFMHLLHFPKNVGECKKKRRTTTIPLTLTFCSTTLIWRRTTAPLMMLNWMWWRHCPYFPASPPLWLLSMLNNGLQKFTSNKSIKLLWAWTWCTWTCCILEKRVVVFLTGEFSKNTRKDIKFFASVFHFEHNSHHLICDGNTCITCCFHILYYHLFILVSVTCSVSPTQNTVLGHWIRALKNSWAFACGEKHYQRYGEGKNLIIN